jgi:hypothetical protein
MSCKHDFFVSGFNNEQGLKQKCNRCGLVIVDRPEVTQRVIDGFAAILDSQDQKGIEKYNRTIDEAEDKDYDWKLMAMEELADYSKYQVKEIQRLEKLVATHWEVAAGYHQEIVQLKQEIGLYKEAQEEYKKAYMKNKEEIEMLKAERDYYKQEAEKFRTDNGHKLAKARLDEMRELQWRNIDLQNEVAALKEEQKDNKYLEAQLKAYEDQGQVITQEAFEKVLKERDEWKALAAAKKIRIGEKNQALTELTNIRAELEEKLAVYQNCVKTPEAYEALRKERDELKRLNEMNKEARDNWEKLAKDGAVKYHRLMNKIRGLSEDA